MALYTDIKMFEGIIDRRIRLMVENILDVAQGGFARRSSMHDHRSYILVEEIMQKAHQEKR